MMKFHFALSYTFAYLGLSVCAAVDTSCVDYHFLGIQCDDACGVAGLRVTVSLWDWSAFSCVGTNPSACEAEAKALGCPQLGKDVHLDGAHKALKKEDDTTPMCAPCSSAADVVLPQPVATPRPTPRPSPMPSPRPSPRPSLRPTPRPSPRPIGSDGSSSAAASVASTTINIYKIYLRNLCSSPIEAAIRYLNPATDEWESKCWYNLDVDQGFYAAAGGRTIQTSNDIWYVYARSLDGQYTWKGNDASANTKSCGGEELDMFRRDYVDADGDLYISFTCDSSRRELLLEGGDDVHATIVNETNNMQLPSSGDHDSEVPVVSVGGNPQTQEEEELEYKHNHISLLNAECDSWLCDNSTEIWYDQLGMINMWKNHTTTRPSKAEESDDVTMIEASSSPSSSANNNKYLHSMTRLLPLVVVISCFLPMM